MSDKTMDLPKYWVKRVSKTRNGKEYYFNTKTSESVWHLADVLKAKSAKTKPKIADTPDKKRKLEAHSTPNLAENRLKSLQKSFSETKSNENKAVEKLTSPEKRLHKVLSATSFKKRNIAEDRMKTLQNNLKKEQVKTELLKNHAKPPKSANVSHNNNEIDKKEENSTSRRKTTSALTTDADLTTKYRDFVAQLKPVSPPKNEEKSKTEEVTNKSVMNLSTSVQNETSNCSNDASNDSVHSEPMDWEYTSDDISNVTLDQSHSTSKDVTEPLDKFETMEQYLNYKNLINDEQEIDQKYFYVIVDTNVFISDLDFVEKLIKINFKNFGHPVIIVPYIVLQELDKIKSRFESKFMTLSLKAKSAIHFLNEKLKEHHKQFCGQSAKDDAEKLISITSQDDDIVNCALQVKEKAKDAVILLSNDINLRNKMIVNGINSYSTSDLEASRDTLKFFTPS
ncbi:transcriptional protein SWT1 [Culicoides brevitarsis]|uniref:transcriptional protein SWT1 n=1 Tax=Culicoides brevitarsis TaxID=469753 RepID=UPI00307C956D